MSSGALRLRRTAAWGIGVALVGAVCGSSRPAWADKKKRDECIAASEDGQLLKVKGQLKAAREKLVLCSDKTCPGAVRKDCEAGLEDLERATPTIVFAAKDAAGKDLTEVSVSVDGEKIVDELDGKAISIDPGKHSVRFETEGLPAHEETVVVREGEKARVVLVTIKDKAKPAAKKPKPKPSKGPSTATWVVGGVGAAALAGAGVIGFVALQKRSSLYDSCGKAGTCSQDEVDSVYTLYDISYVAAGLGGALLATSAVLYFTLSSSDAADTKSVSLAPALGGAVVRGRF